MKNILLVLVLSLFGVSTLMADTSTVNSPTDAALTLKAANMAMRFSSHSATEAVLSSRKSGPNYSGRWAGRFVYLASLSRCNTQISTFLFRHIISQSSRYISLATSHDGNFVGVSRDAGRRVEFSKYVGGKYSVAVVYKNLSNNGKVSSAGYAVYAPSTNCLAAFGANAIKQ